MGTLVVKDGNNTPQNLSMQEDGAGQLVPLQVPGVLAGGSVAPVSGSNPLPVQVVGPQGANPVTARVNSAASTNATLVKGSAGTLFGFLLSNANGAARFMRIFDLNAPPTVGSSIPIVTLALPPNMPPTEITLPLPRAMVNGISYDITADNGDTDTTPVGANDVTGLIEYE